MGWVDFYLYVSQNSSNFRRLGNITNKQEFAERLAFIDKKSSEKKLQGVPELVFEGNQLKVQDPSNPAGPKEKLWGFMNEAEKKFFEVNISDTDNDACSVLITEYKSPEQLFNEIRKENDELPEDARISEEKMKKMAGMKLEKGKHKNENKAHNARPRKVTRQMKGLSYIKLMQILEKNNATKPVGKKVAKEKISEEDENVKIAAGEYMNDGKPAHQGGHTL